MARDAEPRFRSREEALRFYFRASELFTPNSKPGVFSRRRPAWLREAPSLILDFVSLDSCFRDMDEAQLWLLHEIYGPGGFDVKARPLASVLEVARRELPRNGWTPKKIVRLKQSTLEIFEERLRKTRLM